MTLALLAGLLVTAVVDSLNPSALLVTTLLLAGPRPYARASAYISGIFVTYLGVGVGVLSGAGELLTSLTGLLLRPAVVQVLEALLGLVLVGFAIRRLGGRRRTPAVNRKKQLIKGGGLVGAFLTGVTVTAVEGTTALPYFGALAALSRADIGTGTDLVILLAYNAIFVLPPIALVLVHRTVPASFEAILERIRAFVRRLDDRPAWTVTAVLGAALVLDGVLRSPS